MDLGAGADLRAIATDTAAALVQTRDEVEATLRTYVKDVRVYAIEVSSKLAAAKTWFDAFSDIGDFVQNLMGDLATSLPSVDAPVPPYLTIAEIYPQIVPDVTGVIDAVTLAAADPTPRTECKPPGLAPETPPGVTRAPRVTKNDMPHSPRAPPRAQHQCLGHQRSVEENALLRRRRNEYSKLIKSTVPQSTFCDTTCT
mgnify:CR=1 FL=1